MVSFTSSKDHFIIWFILGEVLLFAGILFFAKISEQIKYLNQKNRKSILMLFLGGTGALFFIRLALDWTFIALIAYVGTLFVYLLYARTYIVELNKLMTKYLKFLGEA